MATQKIGTPAEPELLSDYTRNKLCAEWNALEAERLKLQEAAGQKKKRQDAIEKMLGAQLELEGANIVDLPRWQFGWELKKGSFSYKDALVEAIGADELQERVDAVPQKRDFFLRDKGKPDPKRKVATKRGKKKAA